MRRRTEKIVGGGGYQFKFLLSDRLARKGFCSETTVKDHELVAIWESEAGAYIAKKSRRIYRSIHVTKLPKRSVGQY